MARYSLPQPVSEKQAVIPENDNSLADCQRRVQFTNIGVVLADSLPCIAGVLSPCSKEQHGRHFVLVTDGRLRASVKIKGRGWGLVFQPATTSTTPSPYPVILFTASTETASCGLQGLPPSPFLKIPWPGYLPFLQLLAPIPLNCPVPLYVKGVMNNFWELHNIILEVDIPIML